METLQSNGPVSGILNTPAGTLQKNKTLSTGIFGYDAEPLSVVKHQFLRFRHYEGISSLSFLPGALKRGLIVFVRIPI